MSRPTKLIIEPKALVHNIAQIKAFAPDKKIIAMVKANAYGCGVQDVVPVLEGHVDAFGVACLEEALVIQRLGIKTQCILFQGVFSADEWMLVAQHQFACVIHQPQQLHWLLNTPLEQSVQVWLKVNTGMSRLGFKIEELDPVIASLSSCRWVDKDLGLMTHLACADEPLRAENQEQIALFEHIKDSEFKKRSVANSAALISFPQINADFVRPGIMLYGVSPFTDRTALDLGLIPVMRFMSAITAIHELPSSTQVGYGGTWTSTKPCLIGIVAAGYGDGYPRHIAENTPVWINGREVPIVGRVSMDMMAVDLTEHPDIRIGDPVELWGAHILVERIAQSAGTIAYELLCQISERVRW